jgi:hypothetical protein
MIIGFECEGPASAGNFTINSWELHSQILAGFSVGVTNLKFSDRNEFVNKENNTFLNSTTMMEFKITMVRNKESLPLFSFYTLAPLLGFWTIFVSTQFLFAENKKRLEIFAGTMLATFAYLLTIRNFMPPTLTQIESVIIEMVGIWGVLELVRNFLAVLHGNFQKNTKHESLQRMKSDFKPVFLAFGSVIAASILIYVNSFVFPGLNTILMASGQTPWGIFTSLFVYYGSDHLLYNVAGILIFSFLFILTNFFLGSERKPRSIFLPIVVFLTAILSNLFWVIVLPYTPNSGASGVAFALQGVFLGFCLLNCLALKNAVKEKGSRQKNLLFKSSLVNLTLLAMFIIWTQVQPNKFLNIAYGVNILVYLIAFVGSFGLTLLWNPLRRTYLKIKQKMRALGFKRLTKYLSLLQQF